MRQQHCVVPLMEMPNSWVCKQYTPICPATLDVHKVLATLTLHMSIGGTTREGSPCSVVLTSTTLGVHQPDYQSTLHFLLQWMGHSNACARNCLTLQAHAMFPQLAHGGAAWSHPMQYDASSCCVSGTVSFHCFETQQYPI